MKVTLARCTGYGLIDDEAHLPRPVNAIVPSWDFDQAGSRQPLDDLRVLKRSGELDAEPGVEIGRAHV